MGRESYLLKFDEVLTETDKAVYLRFGDFDTWIPKSQIDNWPECQDNDNEIYLPEWLVLEKGLENYEV